MKKIPLKYRIILLLGLLALVGAAFWWWSTHNPEPYAESKTLSDGTMLNIADSEGDAETWGIVVTEESMTKEELLALALKSGTRLVQFQIKDRRPCNEHQFHFSEAEKALGRTPEVVAGTGIGSAFAYRWLAEQKNDKARALSIDFNAMALDCEKELPPEAEHGKWEVIWNDNPESETAIFIRQMERTDVSTKIGEYEATSKELLNSQLPLFLNGEQQSLPVVEIPATVKGPYSDTVTFFYSGDGGWRDLDMICGEYMAARGYPVVGVDALKLFWKYRSAERSTQDLANLMQTYRKKWGAKRFILAGYSFGADILPALYNRLSPQDQASIGAIVLLAFSTNADFEIAVSGWLGAQANETETAPELALIPPQKIFCVYGAEERDESGCTQPKVVGENLELPGGHHFDENYERLAQYIIEAIDKRLGENISK